MTDLSCCWRRQEFWSRFDAYQIGLYGEEYCHLEPVNKVLAPALRVIKQQQQARDAAASTRASARPLLLTGADDKRVREVADVGASGVRLVGRKKGAGARQLLEQCLRAAGESVDAQRRA